MIKNYNKRTKQKRRPGSNPIGNGKADLVEEGARRFAVCRE